MFINAINQISPALPYSGSGAALSVDRGGRKFPANDDGVAFDEQTRPRIEAVDNINFAANDQRRQQTQRINSLMFVRENATSVPATSSTARILGELINRMGGSGSDSGPGKVLNITV